METGIYTEVLRISVGSQLENPVWTQHVSALLRLPLKPRNSSRRVPNFSIKTEEGPKCEENRKSETTTLRQARVAKQASHGGAGGGWLSDAAQLCLGEVSRDGRAGGRARAKP